MKIGVTGGIGAGKSEVMKIIGDRGYATLSADDINAALLVSPDYLKKLEGEFPDAFLDGKLSKGLLREIVFSASERRERLNALAHPQIFAEIAEAKESPLFVEVPLLYECGAQALFDKVIAVTADKASRIKRLGANRGIAPTEAERIIAAQADDWSQAEYADFVIKNDGDLGELNERVLQILAALQL